jgi:acetylornithine/N-succinyldiaminopimelate aminotransferase
MTSAPVLVLLAASTGESFLLSPSVAAASRSISALPATIEKITSSSLVPPKSIDDMMKTSETADLYDLNVQKTYGRYPLTIRNGKGCKLYTTDGKEYLDCVAGIATCALGHANDYLTNAIVQQMNSVHHVSNLYLIPSQAALAHWLCDNSVAEKVFFCNSGAEANEAAIKCARRHASNRGITKPVIITAKDSFHGRTLAALTATAQPKYHKGFGYDGQMVQGFKYITYNSVDELRAAVQEVQESGQGLAAIMMEALQGEGGIIAGDVEFFRTIREICDETGALMMCDEVQVGMGRSGRLWGYENLGVEPDIFTSAKALGGGVPIGAMMARGDAANVFGPGDHASTYGGNPLACSAGLAVASYMCEHDLLTNVKERGTQLEAGLQAVAEKYPDTLGAVRGWGLMRGVVVTDSSIPPGAIVQAAMDEGLLLVAAGSNVVRFVPPLIISADEIDAAMAMFEAAVAKVVAKNKDAKP